MNRFRYKIIFYTLIALVAFNLFLIASGIVIPFLISKDKMPLVAIMFLVTCFVSFFVTMVVILINKILK